MSKKGAAGFSLDAVAKAARVTRLTVYNQFGSRRALLEAVFDDRARQGGLFRVAEALSDPDPASGLRRLIAIFCEFWSFNESAITHMLAAGASDPEFAESIRQRNERRRMAVGVLIERIAGANKIDKPDMRDLVDSLFALASHAFFSELRQGGRTPEEACTLIEHLAFTALKERLAHSPR